MKTAVILFTAAILTMAAGCASSSRDIGKAYVSPTKYKAYSCEELVEEAAYISQKVEALAQSLDKTANLDTAQTTGAILLSPFTFGSSLFILGALEGGDGPEAVEYARLKGEYEAIRESATRKKCRL